jgi:hypothetical protein
MKGIFAIAALAALGVSPVYAACTSPGNPPNVPDGTTAKPDDIMKAQQDVVSYQNSTNTFLACIKKEHDDAIAAAGPGISSTQADKIDHAEADQHNAAVHQLNDVVNRFNQSVAAYKAKNAPKKSDDTDKSKSGG